MYFNTISFKSLVREFKNAHRIRQGNKPWNHVFLLLDPSGLATRPPDTKEFVSRSMLQLSRNVMNN